MVSHHLKPFGKYPEVSLKDARLKREEYSSIIARGSKPAEVVDNEQMTLGVLMEEYNKHRGEITEKYIADNTNILKRDFDNILDKKLDDITISDMINGLAGMEKRGLKEAPKKAGGFLNRLFRYAVTKQYTTNNPMASIDLTILLQKHKAKNFPHITDEKIFKQLLQDIENYTGWNDPCFLDTFQIAKH